MTRHFAETFSSAPQDISGVSSPSFSLLHSGLVEGALPLIRLALEEDIGAGGDVTSESIFSPSARARAEFRIKQSGVVCGLDIARRVCEEVAASDGSVLQWRSLFADGASVESGAIAATVEGAAITLLKAERVALNFLQRLSGVATLTRRYAEAIAGGKTRIIDTRKTLPGWRALDKYAVLTGGGANHRFGLYDMALIKDNHRDAAGSLSEALRLCNARLAARPDVPIEVETRSLDDVRELLSCLDAGLRAERVMFDNFTPAEVGEGVRIVGGRMETEASGGVTLETAPLFAAQGVDFISVGALTHSAPALDISMKFA
jgi:nicotinate-nucleotide pyrophosphorylase (carboxylating)